MPKNPVRDARQLVYLLLGLQIIVTMIITGLFWGLSSGVKAYSASLGGLICIVTNALFAKQVFAVTFADAANRIVKAFYRAECFKILLNALLFGLVIKFVAVAGVPLFVGFISAQMMFWFAPMLMMNKRIREIPVI